MKNRPLHSHCDVCDCEIANIDLLPRSQPGYTVCRAPECRRIMDKKSSMTEPMFDAHLKFNRRILTRRRELQEQKNQYMRSVVRKESDELLHVRERVFEKFDSIGRDNIAFLTIPSANPSTKITSNERKKVYISYLKKIIRDACSSDESNPVEEAEQNKAYKNSIELERVFEVLPGLQDVSDQLCIMCKGGCCASGENHAYLSAVSIRRYLNANPDVTAVELFKMYLSHVNIESTMDACINQASTGCSLPRDLRSDICNAFYCDSLERYHKRSADNNTINTVVAVQRSSTYWNRFDPDVKNEIIDIAIIDNDGCRSIKKVL